MKNFLIAGAAFFSVLLGLAVVAALFLQKDMLIIEGEVNPDSTGFGY